MPEGSKDGGEVATGTGQPPGLIPQGAYLTHAGGQERRSQGGGERTDRYKATPWAMPDRKLTPLFYVLALLPCGQFHQK